MRGFSNPFGTATEELETIVITGASRGIGQATARRLAEPGRHLVLLARSEQELAGLCRQLRRLGTRADYVVADLSSVESAKQATAELLARISRLDLLVLNAGMSNDRLFTDTSPEAIVYEAGVNYLAPVTLMHGLLPQLTSTGGHVIFVGSLTAVVPFPSNATYAATKAALLALVRSIRVEMAESGVHFGIVLPGPTRTQMTVGKPSRLPFEEPDTVARAIVRCIEERTGIETPGLSNRLAGGFFRGFPGISEWILNRVKTRLVPGLADHRPADDW